jgi:hypothetical protein
MPCRGKTGRKWPEQRGLATNRVRVSLAQATVRGMTRREIGQSEYAECAQWLSWIYL